MTKNIDVTVITLNTGRCDEIRALGVNVIEIELHRGYSNLLYEFNTLIKIYRILRSLSPDVLELVTIKAVLYGGLVSKLLKINKTVFYISGLGAIFTNDTRLGRLKAVVTTLYKFIMRSTSTEVIVENDDDKHKFTSLVI